MLIKVKCKKSHKIMSKTNEAQARIKINSLLKESGWCFFDDLKNKANVVLEPNVKLTKTQIDELGENFEETKNGFVDFLLLDEKGYPSINQKDVESISFPLPSIDIQREIVAEIESFQKIIDGARLVLNSYEPRIRINSKWPLLSIENIAEINPKKSELKNIDEVMPVSFVPMSDLQEKEMFFEAKDTKPLNEVIKQYTYFLENDVLLAKVTPCFENGKAGIARNLVNGIGFGSSEFYVLRANQEKVLPEWVYLSVANQTFRNHAKDRMTGTGGLQRVPRDVLAEWKIPVPETLDEQKVIIEEIKIEQSLVSSNLELIKRFEQKIKDKIDSIWSS